MKKLFPGRSIYVDLTKDGAVFEGHWSGNTDMIYRGIYKWSEMKLVPQTNIHHISELD